MDNDFMQYVYTRIKKVLEENADYMKLQSDGVIAIETKDYPSYIDISDDLQSKAEELCYMQGYKDAMQIILNLK